MPPNTAAKPCTTPSRLFANDKPPITDAMERSSRAAKSV
eukprot:CAMPEP_0170131364 /NCGR_PEP_ID=MMETSP0020_2-20130122/23202_1 /TAXON_ID=98059 /ORGANISM="Dinobryon sp., Strain UTEXLB2267" /LENGTH=38 /DNA_ID= /DNA_START= /DNA_END= /DNA_ORIENTATION=